MRTLGGRRARNLHVKLLPRPDASGHRKLEKASAGAVDLDLAASGHTGRAGHGHQLHTRWHLRGRGHRRRCGRRHRRWSVGRSGRRLSWLRVARWRGSGRSHRRLCSVPRRGTSRGSSRWLLRSVPRRGGPGSVRRWRGGRLCGVARRGTARIGHGRRSVRHRRQGLCLWRIPWWRCPLHRISRRRSLGHRWEGLVRGARPLCAFATSQLPPHRCSRTLHGGETDQEHG